VTGWWFSLATPVLSTNKTDRHDITEILLKVALNIINQTKLFSVMLAADSFVSCLSLFIL
jgi:hypothetical protein